MPKDKRDQRGQNFSEPFAKDTFTKVTVLITSHIYGNLDSNTNRNIVSVGCYSPDNLVEVVHKYNTNFVRSHDSYVSSSHCHYYLLTYCGKCFHRRSKLLIITLNHQQVLFTEQLTSQINTNLDILKAKCKRLACMAHNSKCEFGI